MSKKRHNSNAITLIQLLQKGQLIPERLTPHMRKVIVKYYFEEDSFSSTRAIAELIGVTEGQVRRLKNNMLKKGAWEIEELDVKLLATRLTKKMSELQRRASVANDWSLVWQIEKDYISLMQSMGYIYKAPEHHKHGLDESALQVQMKEYFNEFGVPTVKEFVALLAAAQGDGGNGRKLLVEQAGTSKTVPAVPHRKAKGKRA